MSGRLFIMFLCIRSIFTSACHPERSHNAQIILKRISNILWRSRTFREERNEPSGKQRTKWGRDLLTAFDNPLNANVTFTHAFKVTFKSKGIAINRSRSLPHYAHAPFVAFCSTRTSSPKKFDYVTRENKTIAILFFFCDSAQDDTLRRNWREVIKNIISKHPDKSQFEAIC